MSTEEYKYRSIRKPLSCGFLCAVVVCALLAAAGFRDWTYLAIGDLVFLSFIASLGLFTRNTIPESLDVYGIAHRELTLAEERAHPRATRLYRHLQTVGAFSFGALLVFSIAMMFSLQKSHA